MPTDQVQCPHCYSKELRIVGCYVYSQQGAPYSDDFSFLDLKHEDTFESQKMFRCESCQKHVTQVEANTAAAFAEPATRWEKSMTGRVVPVICPICKNRTNFVREQLALSEQIHNVMVGGMDVEVLDLLTEDLRETVTLNYRCGLEECPGIVQVNEDTFKVSPL